MDKIQQLRDERLSSPILSLVVVICIVAVMTTISFLSFWQSDTKELVRTIQDSSQSESNFQPAASGVDQDGVLSVAELLFIVEGVQADAAGLSPETDFGGGTLQKTELGF